MADLDGLFDRRTLIALIVATAIGFIGMVAMQIFADDLVPRRTAGSSAYSYSAIGHHGAVETLRRSGYNVVVSRYDSAGKAGIAGILVLAEPLLPALSDQAMAGLQRARNILLVLPKWQGTADPQQPDWLSQAELLPTDYVDAVLTKVTGYDGTGIARNVEDTVAPPAMAVVAPTLTSAQFIDAAPQFARIGTEQGVLLAMFPRVGRNIWVVSDPDILANHGLGRGDNAGVLLEIVRHISPTARAIVFDETLHGFEQRPSLWYAIFEFPFILVTFCCAIALAVFLWAATGRFGAPLPSPPTLRPGKAGLIANTAELLRAGGHASHILSRYVDATISDVALRLHCPHGLSLHDRLEWLDRIGMARGVRDRITDIHAQAARIRGGRPVDSIANLAQRLHRWKQEMVHGA